MREPLSILICLKFLSFNSQGIEWKSRISTKYFDIDLHASSMFVVTAKYHIFYVRMIEFTFIHPNLAENQAYKIYISSW
jgi:hypothetical protein